jgi:hypothetical protein
MLNVKLIPFVIEIVILDELAHSQGISLSYGKKLNLILIPFFSHENCFILQI